MNHDEAVTRVRAIARAMDCDVRPEIEEQLQYVADMADAAKRLEEALRRAEQWIDKAIGESWRVHDMQDPTLHKEIEAAFASFASLQKVTPVCEHRFSIPDGSVTGVNVCVKCGERMIP